MTRGYLIVAYVALNSVQRVTRRPICASDTLGRLREEAPDMSANEEVPREDIEFGNPAAKRVSVLRKPCSSFKSIERPVRES